MKHPRRSSGAPRVIIALGIAAAIVIGSIALAIYFVSVRTPLDVAHGAKEETFDAANRIANGFRNAFNFTPQITVNGVTEVEQASSIMELATAKQDVVEHYQWSQTWLGSTKTMELQGIYWAKAGFDLRDICRVSVEGGRVTAILPAPKLLSLEMAKYTVLKDTDGWWNKITSADREKAIAEMQEEARQKAAQSGILAEAKARFMQQFGDALKAQNIFMPVETRFQDESPGAATPQGK